MKRLTYGGTIMRLAGQTRWLRLLPGWVFLLCLAATPAAWAQVSYVGSTSANGGAGAASSVNVARPAGVLFADMLIAQIAVNPATAVVTAPSGWTLISEVTSGNVRQRLFYRSVATGEPASYNFSVAPSARTAATVIAMRGVETISPVFASSSIKSGSSATPAADEVAVALSDSALLAFFGMANGNASLSVNTSLSGGATASTAAGPNGVAIANGYELGVGLGLSGSRSATASLSAAWGAQMVALRPSVQSCFTDNFNRTTLGTDWAVTRRGGSFDPTIVGNRMRMTQALGNQATAATLQRLVPADGNLFSLEFNHYAYGGNGADGIVFVLSDASVTPQPGAFGGSLGYANNASTSGFAGGWMGVGLDEYGNYSNNTESRRARPPGWTTPNGINPSSGLRTDAVVVRGSMPNYYFIAGTNSLSPGVDVISSTAGPGYRYRVSVDSRVAGEAWVTVERLTSGVFTALIPRFNILAANSAQQDGTGVRRTPENFLVSITGGTGGSNHNHEFDDFKVCALALRPFNAEIDHFRFYHDGAASACQAEPVRLLACADAACSSLFPDSVTATLATSAGEWQDASGNALSGNAVSFSGGAVNLKLLRNTTGTELLNVVASTPSTKSLSVPKCFNSATNAQFGNCNLSFTDTQSFTFGVPPLSSIPAQEAGLESAAVRIKATSSSCGGGTPTAFRNQVQPVQFLFAYLDPVQATVDALITAAASRPKPYLDPWEGNTAGVPVNSTQRYQQLALSNTALSVYFNNSGEGYFQIVYPDVGQLRLTATGTGSITGSSAFVVKPWEFLVDNVVRTADNFANPAAVDATGAVFIRAGENFTARVTARNAPHKITDGSGSTVTNPVLTAATAHGRITKLFSKEQTPESVRLSSDGAALQPAGGFNPAIANGAVLSTSFGTGTELGRATVSTLAWPEVGIIRLQPKILPTGSETSGDYLGAGDVTRYSSPNIGRFYPYEFGFSNGALLNRADLACAPASTFSYLDEPMTLSFTLQARNKAGGITQNYAGAFAKLALAANGASLNLAAARVLPTFAALTGRLTAAGFTAGWPAVGAADAGTAAVSGTLGISSLNTPANNRVAPDGPYLLTNIGIAPVDGDGVRIANYDLDSDNSGGAGGMDHRSVATTNLYFGQLRLLPAIGSERLSAALPVEVLRWAGSGFVPNGDDACTSVPLAQLGLRDWAGNLNAGETSVGGALTIAAGHGVIRLAAPGVGNNGQVNVTANLAGAGLAYLGGRWPALPGVADATPALWDDAPWATASFGLFRGVNQVIYRRENY